MAKSSKPKTYTIKPVPRVTDPRFSHMVVDDRAVKAIYYGTEEKCRNYVATGQK